MKQRWQPKREAAGHVDDWLMTYADVITLLLCFFAVFLCLSAPKKDAPTAVPIAQAAPLRVSPPDLREGALPQRRLEPPALLLAQQQAAPLEAKAAAPLATAAAPSTLLEARDATAKAAAAASGATSGRSPPGPARAAPQPEAEPVKPSAVKAEEPKGDRITSFEIGSAALFASGSADLSSGGEAILRDAAAELNSDKFKDYDITVEGHTDDTPINTPRFPSNWELSTARAAAVLHYLLDQGVPAERLRAAGYADTFPKVPNRDADGNSIPANQAQNRRVVIVLEKIEKAAGAAAVQPDAAPPLSHSAPQPGAEAGTPSMQVIRPSEDRSAAGITEPPFR